MAIYLRTLGYFWPDRTRILLLLVLIGSGTLVSLVQVWPMIVLVDSVVSHAPQSGWIHTLVLAWLPERPPAQIIALAALALALRLLQEVLNRARIILNLQIGYAGLLRVRCELYQKLQALSLAYHWAHPQGGMI